MSPALHAQSLSRTVFCRFGWRCSFRLLALPIFATLLFLKHKHVNNRAYATMAQRWTDPPAVIVVLHLSNGLI
jgi:hypothetical protein